MPQAHDKGDKGSSSRKFEEVRWVCTYSPFNSSLEIFFSSSTLVIYSTVKPALRFGNPLSMSIGTCILI